MDLGRGHDAEERSGGGSAGEDPWSGPGEKETGEDPWSGPGKKETGEDPWSGPGMKESGTGRRKAKFPSAGDLLRYLFQLCCFRFRVLYLGKIYLGSDIRTRTILYRCGHCH